MYNEITKECSCNRCNHSWRSRTDKAPLVCSSCTSKLWNSGARKFEVIIARSCGREENGERLKFCVLDYIDRPGIETEDIFYMTKEDADKYLVNRRFPNGSGMVFIGSFEVENLELKVHEMKLIYGHSPGFREYLTDASCLYNIKSYYEKLKAQKLREAEAERLAAIKAEKERQLLEAAAARIEEEAQKELQVEQAKRTISDDSATTEERLRAVSFLEQRA